MSRKTTITLDDIKNYFSLNREIEQVEVAPRATGGLGINNIVESCPVFHQNRITRGTDYVKIAKEKEKRNEKNIPKLASGSGRGRLAAVEELSTTVGEVPNLNDLSLTDVQEIHSRFYQTDIQYNTKLSITNYREQILQLMSINQVVIIKGCTGCGKTTQVPQYILDYYTKTKKNCSIVVTQPRKIAAISIAKRVCHERNWQLGSIVGYRVGLDDKTSPDTRLTYVTTGVLLQQLINERQITRFSHIIVDEVHERDQDTDFVLLILKKLIKTNSPHVKVILMSATIDTSLFANYFALNAHSDLAPVIEITGKQNDVQEYYIDDLSRLGVQIPEFHLCNPFIPNELYDLAVRLLSIFDRVDLNEPRSSEDEKNAPKKGAVLIFLPGYEEISRMMGKLRPLELLRKLKLVPLHSTITVMEQSQIFQPASEGFRKVIISTNIAESSITVPDIKYVIDFCLTKNLVSDPETNYTSLRLEWASKSNCTQRKGRAGRLFMGRVYRFVTQIFYKNEIPEIGIPEMMRTSLTQVVLKVKKINLCEPLHLLALALDPPEQYSIEQAILILKQVGALSATVSGELSNVDGDLTFIGRIMSKLPLDVKISKLIILGYVFGFLDETIIIAACLSLRSFFTKSFDRVLDFYKSTLAWANGTYSDCFAYLNAYKMWKEYHARGYFRRPGGQDEIDWGKQNFIQIKRIKEVDLLVTELKKRLEQISIESFPNRRRTDENHDILMLKVIIAGAFFPNYYTQDEIDEQSMLREVGSGDIYSTVHLTNLPAHGVLYYSAIQEMMSLCGTRMAIEFENRKAYLHFDRRGIEEELSNSTSDSNRGNKSVPAIHPAVYFAIKMRLLRVPLNLQVFSDQDAERRMTQLQNIRRQLQRDCKILSSNRMIVQLPSFSLKRVDPPRIDQTAINIFITHVVDCGHFWARYADQEKNSLIVFIEYTINAGNGISLLPVTKDLVCGSLVLAPYSEGQNKIRYYRASVEEIGKLILVFFIDYGNTKYIDKRDLRQMNYKDAPDVLDTPALAFECQLCEVKPAAIKSFEWSEASTKWFKEIVRNRTLSARVYSVVKSVCRLELFYHLAGNNLNSINKELIQKGFAERAEESLVSKQNYDLRSECNQLNELPLDSDIKPFQLTTKDLMGTEEPRLMSTPSTLRGPYSSLEASYSGMSFVDRYKTVKIENDSVNSVSLNREPQDKNPQLLVACDVALSSSSDSLTLRSTTLMPKIRGLSSLLCLMFAPYVEFRTDPERKAYTGALCGLGFDPATGEAFAHDHDIEVPFDIEIDYSDICLINGIRMGINMVLNSDSDFAEFQKHDLMKIQKQIKDTLTDLLKRTRNKREPWNFPRCYMWNQVNSQHILKPQLEDDLDDCQTVLPLLHGICLSDATLEIDLKEHLRTLYKMANKSSFPQPVYCRLCAYRAYNPRALLIHLDSEPHKRQEQLLHN